MKLFVFVLFLMELAPGSAKSLDRFPLKGGSTKRHSRRTPGCWLGRKYYALEERWNPVIEPMGKMHCVKCQCVPVFKKGILMHQGVVRCKNIKTQCPEPTCDNPVLRPNHCCKSCPDQSWFEDSFSLISSPISGSQLSNDVIANTVDNSEFTSLLVGRNIHRPGPVLTRASAKINFVMTASSTLAFSLIYAEMAMPRFVQLVGSNRKVLMEIPIENSRNNRICGAFKDIPDLYIDLLVRQTLRVVITSTTHPDGEIAGDIVPKRKSGKETFSALLVSSQPEGIGGHVEMVYNTRARMLKYVIKHEGLFASRRTKREYFVTLEKKTEIVYEDNGRVKREGDIVVGKWRRISKSRSRMLARGRLQIRITSKGGITMGGMIQPMFSCDTVQAVLSSSESFSREIASSAGSAIFNLSPRGDLEYKIQLSGLTSDVTGIKFETAPNKRGKRKTIVNVVSTFTKEDGSFNGLAKGRLSKLKAGDLALFLAERLYIQISTHDNPMGELRGQISQIPYNGDVEKNVAPFLLESSAEAVTGAAGHAWFTMDENCELHYDIILGGLSDPDGALVALLESGEYASSKDSDAIHSVVISQFQNGRASGSIKSSPEVLYLEMDRGHALLKIVVKGVNPGTLQTNISIPNTCWDVLHDMNTDMLIDEQENEVIDPFRYSCRYEGKVYGDGESWLPIDGQECNTCYCKRGSIRCHQVMCAPIQCDNPVKLPGQCCHTCPDATYAKKPNETCYFNGDKRHHPVGVDWHPYVPPFGYMKCVLCRCVPGSNEVNCTRNCPVLNCPKENIIQPKKNECCPKCSDKHQNVKKTVASSIQRDIHMDGSCMFGDNIYENGSRWNPRVSSFGSMKCIICTCNFGETSCEKKRCPKLDCPKRQVTPPNSCCPICPGRQKASNRKRKHGTDSV